MTANLLTLNSFKTEFLQNLLIGLKQQLSKTHDSSLTTTHSARKLDFIFDEHLTFSDQISALSKSCYYHIRELRCIRPYLDFKTASTIATSVVHSNLITVTLSITTFQTINLTGSNRSRTLLLVLLLRLLNPHISLPFSNLSTGLRSTNALNINFFLLPKVLTTSQPSYLNNLISVQPPRPRTSNRCGLVEHHSSSVFPGFTIRRLTRKIRVNVPTFVKDSPVGSPSKRQDND